jgi:Rab5 GDP/GTP exchange factor
VRRSCADSSHLSFARYSRTKRWPVIMADEETEARRQFLSQRDAVIQSARVQTDSSAAFGDFASFGAATPTVGKPRLDIPGDVTDATELFFDAIVAGDEKVPDDNDQKVDNTPTAVSDERRAELLKNARESQTTWVDGGNQQLSPPPPNFARKAPGDSGGKNDLALFAEFDPLALVEGEADNTRKKTEPTVSNLKKSTLEAAAGVEGSKGIVDTTDRLFGFLNRFGADSSSEGKKKSGPKMDNQPKPTKPFNYKVFREKMKSQPAAEFVKSMKNFVLGTMREYRDTTRERVSREDSGTRVRSFLKQLESRMASSDHWKTESEDEWDNTVEGLEKFLMAKIYEAVFCPREVDKEEDINLSKRIRSLNFISFQHLDISGAETGPEFTHTWKLAMSELRKMDGYKAPRDKMVCLLNCCKVISQLLNDARAANDEKLPGADEFLPALIYVVLKANPPNLRSNLAYIDAFRNPDKMLSEPGYWYTNLYSAVSFVETVTYDKLTITREEFMTGISSSMAAMEAAPPPSAVHDAPSTASSVDGMGTERETTEGSLSFDQQEIDYMNAGPPKLSPPLQNEDVSELAAWKARRFRFMTTRVEDLKVLDVADLLEEYKNLVMSCGNLLQERTVGGLKP